MPTRGSPISPRADGEIGFLIFGGDFRKVEPRRREQTGMRMRERRHRGWWLGGAFASMLAVATFSGRSEKPAGIANMEWQHGDGEPELAAGVLAIPPRLQWPNDHGYCGETSLQAIGLYYGAWISQKVIRETAGGEMLLGANAELAARKLRFQCEAWPGGKSAADCSGFVVWLKSRLLDGYPAIVGVYLRGDGHDDPDYDHIVPVVGVRTAQADSRRFDGRDRLVFHNNFSLEPIERPVDTLFATRSACASDVEGGGCIPKKRVYALVIKGIVDPAKATFPVRMTVERWDEPNVSLGAEPVPMRAAVTVTGLERGRTYALLRYDSVQDLPASGGVGEYLASNYARKTEFIAATATCTARDPEPFRSDGAVFYRCVQVR